ncbi:hypothetical protein [Marimonas lutisalis]|uniref:hypothetical protein n=1 Tax=Marimonas lutisalis TaxID=2545756 RepID=UPI0010F44CF7|nr:hypothetical protein [Marimonas lutisalis]
MSTVIEIPADEHGVIRLFAVDLEGDAARRFNRRNGTWPLRDALGAETLDPAHVECFDLSDLAGLGLSGYLDEGLGVPTSELSGLRPRLDALRGWVAVITSRAFAGVSQRLTPRPPLRLIATLHEERPPVIFERLPSEAAKGRLSATGTAPAPTRGRGWIAPLLLVLALVALAAFIFTVTR